MMEEESENINIVQIKLKIKNGMYYILTALLSIVSLVVFPMLDNSHISFKEAFPTTPTAWTLWVVERVLIVFMNIMIMSNFILQAKKNVKENANYIMAKEILNKNKPKDYKPRSPAQFLSRMYINKGVTLIISTLASLIAIGEAAVNYNYLLLIATAVTLVIALTFGYIAMKSTEEYWTGEYLDYAKMVEEKEKSECLKSETKLSETCKNKLEKTKI